MIHDVYCRKICTEKPNLLVAWWLMAAWAYDVDNDPILTDAGFDWIASELDRQWDQIEHRHKNLLDRNLLKSAIAVGGQYPDLAMGSARVLQRAEVSPPRIMDRHAAEHAVLAGFFDDLPLFQTGTAS